jgi:hypothetical protein
MKTIHENPQPEKSVPTGAQKRSHTDLNLGDHQDDVTMDPPTGTRTVQETIKARGENMLERETKIMTKLRMEFNVPKDTEKYPMRHNMIQLIDKMKTVDPTLTIQSVLDTTQWQDPSKLPVKNDLLQHFNIHEEPTNSGPTRVVANLLVHRATKSSRRSNSKILSSNFSKASGSGSKWTGSK